MAVTRKDIVNPPSPDVSKNSVLAISEGQTRINLAIVQSQKENQTKDEVQRIINTIIASIVLDIKDSATRILVRRSLVEYAQVQFYTWLQNSTAINKRLFNELLSKKNVLEFDTNGAIRYLGSTNSFVVNRDNKTYRIHATVDELKTNRKGNYLDEFATPIDVLTDDRFRNVANDIKNIVPVIKDYQSLVNEQIKAFATNPPKVTYTSSGAVRKMNIRAYAEMKVRYEANQKDLNEFRKQQNRPGSIDEADLVWTSSHANCSKRCEVWQGRLFSLSNRTGKTSDGKPYSSLDEALQGVNKDGNGIINGYNCRHFLIAYRFGSTPPTSYTADEIKKQRAIDQAQRSRENTIRNLKSRARVLAQLGQNDKAKALLKKANMLTAKYRIFSLDNKRAYLEWRTKILPNENELNLIQNGLQIQPITQKEIAPVPVAPPPPPVKTEREVIVEKFNKSQALNQLRNVIANSISQLNIGRSGNLIDKDAEVNAFNQDINERLINNPNVDPNVLKVIELFFSNTGNRRGTRFSSKPIYDVNNNDVSHYASYENRIYFNMKADTDKNNGYWTEAQNGGLNSSITTTHFHELGHFIDNNIGKAIPFAENRNQNYYITSTFVDKVDEIETNTGVNVLQKDIINTLFNHNKVKVIIPKDARFSNQGKELVVKFSDFVKTDKNGEVKFSGASIKRLLDYKSNDVLGNASGFIHFHTENETPDEARRTNEYNLKTLKEYGLDDKKYPLSSNIQEQNTFALQVNTILKNSRLIYLDGINVNGTKYMTGDIKDITSGVTENGFGWGHSKSYMKTKAPAISVTKDIKNPPLNSVTGTDKEITAEFFEATVVGGYRLEAIKLFYPETYKVWYEAFKENIELAIKGQEQAKASENDPNFKADARWRSW